NQVESVQLALSRTDHIHARIGHQEGPQVTDPRAPEWEQAVKAHFAWWDTIAETKRKWGQPLTILTEFGPPNYLPTVPYTKQPLANQWEINVHMMKSLRERYA
ncbi:MAG: sugar phosphate isomerase/epimerase, partial [Bacteroidota bacterium]